MRCVLRLAVLPIRVFLLFFFLEYFYTFLPGVNQTNLSVFGCFCSFALQLYIKRMLNCQLQQIMANQNFWRSPVITFSTTFFFVCPNTGLLYIRVLSFMGFITILNRTWSRIQNYTFTLHMFLPHNVYFDKRSTKHKTK